MTSGMTYEYDSTVREYLLSRQRVGHTNRNGSGLDVLGELDQRHANARLHAEERRGGALCSDGHGHERGLSAEEREHYGERERPSVRRQLPALLP